MNQKASKKERILEWWRIEGKIECAGALIALIILIVYWHNPLVEGAVVTAAALWGFGKIYFKRKQWAFLLIVSTWMLWQGLSILLTHMRSIP